MLFLYPLFNIIIRSQQQSMSKLLFKIMANSYCRQLEHNTLITDCLTALNRKIQQIEGKVGGALKQIKQVISLPSEAGLNEMSVILQQETQRSIHENMGYQKFLSYIRQQFNTKIGRLVKIERDTDKLVNIYKGQLVQISGQIKKWETKNKELKKELKKFQSLNQKLKVENNDLKDQITNESARIFLKESDEIDSVFTAKETEQNLDLEQTYKFKIKKQDKQKEKQRDKSKQKRNEGKVTKKRSVDEKPKVIIDSQIKNIQKSCQNSKKQEKPHTIQISVKDNETEEELQKWKKLSKKIDELKNKLLIYEEQIEQKDNEIQKLKLQVKKLKLEEGNESEERRKLKSANTTLRGEKTVLQNQINLIKKQLSEKVQLCSIQQTDIQQLKVQVQNANQTLKWQASTIQDLQSSYSKNYNKSTEQFENKYDKLRGLNEQLVAALDLQQTELEEMNKRCKKIDELTQNKINEMKGRIGELQIILQQKNECIVKMKTRGAGGENLNPNTCANGIQSQNYLTELVRVLTKKVADRDQIIRRLQAAR